MIGGFLSVDDSIIVETVRINASYETREKRGWVYNEDIDESVGECGLDYFEFDHIIDNDGTIKDLQAKIRNITFV